MLLKPQTGSITRTCTKTTIATFAPDRMKQFLVTILALVYLTSTVGATLRLDCCLENLVKARLVTGTQDAHWSKENKDCKDDHKQAKFGHEQKRNDNHLRVAKIFPATTTTGFPEYAIHAVDTLTDSYPVNNAPLRQASIPLFILNCVHRI